MQRQRVGRWIALVCMVVVFTAVPGRGRAETRPTIHNWLCYYGDRFGPEIYTRFDLVVLDSRHHPPLPTRADAPPVLGYLSVGEVDKDGPYWGMARHQDYLVTENRFWNSWMVDVRDPTWQRLLFQVAIPAIFSQGFDGLFLDTFDSSLHLLSLPDGHQRFQGTGDALTAIVRTIKTRYPDKYLAVNRGLPILGHTAPWLDFIVAEDLYSYYNDQTKAYERVEPATRNQLVAYIHKGLAVNPSLTVLAMDYAAADQPDLAREAIQFSRNQGYVPYVSTLELDQIFFYTLEP